MNDYWRTNPRPIPAAVALPAFLVAALIAGGVYGLETLADRMRGLR